MFPLTPAGPIRARFRPRPPGPSFISTRSSPATRAPPEPYEEGCLSLPDIRGDVLRPPTVTITAYDLQGRQFTTQATGLLARCWQHEVDHLDGVLILDRMTQMSRLRNRSAIRDLERSERL
jgi:peptide deformylase